MATENLRHQIGDNPNENTHDYDDYEDDYEDEDEYDDYIEDSSMKGRMLRWRAAIARHGFWSLAVAISPASLYLVDIFFLRSAERASARPSWFLTPLINRDVHFVLSSVLMSLSSWFAWAENGLPQNPRLFASRLVGYTALSLAWDPIVFGWGAINVGLFVCVLRGLLAIAISNMIKRQNDTAGEFIFRTCGMMDSMHLFQCSLDLLVQ